jgi:DNA polymerase elongation subunit (family B)
MKLKFVNDDVQVKEVVDTDYKPYFIAPYPLTEQQRKVVENFSGKTEMIEKIDLWSNEKLALTKVFWPSVAIASKSAKGFDKCWESEINAARSYVYDKGLVFGARLSDDCSKVVSDVPLEAKERFDKTFNGIRERDPLKYDQILYWFSIIEQPIPDLNPTFFGFEEVDSEKLHVTWLLSRIANIPLAEAFTSTHVSDWIKSIIYAHLRKNHILIPTSEELRRGKPTHRVTGALTVSPIAGIYFKTVVCDFESLYASCIDSFNLSYETVDCNHPECKTNRIADIDYHVCTKYRGFYSILFGALKELRIRLFKPAVRDNSLPEQERRIAAAASKLLKLLAVSSYGVTVRIHGLACPPLAEAITGYGRYVLRESWKMAEANGLRPLYGDTDSLFLDNVTDEQVEWLIKAIKERFRLDLIVDKQYNLCVLPRAKKAYFGILPDGTPDIKGVTAVKSNSPTYVNNVFQQCVKMLSTVTNQNEFDQAKKSIREIVWKAIDDLKNRRIRLQDLRYSVKLYFDPNEKIADMKTSPQPYQCALQMIQAGRMLKRGDTVPFIKVKPFRYGEKIFTVKPSDAVTNIGEINVNDYIRNLLTALNQTFEPMGIKLEAERDAGISKWLTN